MNRCLWTLEKNKNYIKYHDEEWGKPSFDDNYLFEMLILESFQAGLSWDCILNKRENFKKAFDNFNIDKIINYNEEKINELMDNKGIVRNKLKISAMINNSKRFKEIQKEYNSFSNYIWSFTNNKIIYEVGKTKSDLSNKISKDLKKRGMKFVGTIIIYSYLQAIGIINSHEGNCFKYKRRKAMREVKPNTTWRHFKGSIVRVIALAKHTETMEELVIYECLNNNTNHVNEIYARPLDMFLSEVDHEKYPDVKQKYRLEQIDEITSY